MSLIRIVTPDTVRPSHVVMIAVLGITLLGSCLLYSGTQSVSLPDGAKEWPADSWLRTLVALCNFNFTQPTPAGSDVKDLIFGLGTALAVFSVGVAVSRRPRPGEEVEASDTVLPDPEAPRQAVEGLVRRPLPLPTAAQVFMLAYVGWSFLSILWSDADDIALYGSLELALCLVWSLALAYGVNRASAVFGAYVLVAAGAVTAAVAVGYHIERNPTLRASYPIGNPITLGAVLMPCLLVTVGLLVGQVRDFGNPHRVRRFLVTLVCLGLGVLFWVAFWHAEARGALVGLVAGLAGLFFFALRWRGKLAVVGLALVGAVLAVWLLLPRVTDYSPRGRDASFRFRYYAWGYGLELLRDHKLLGHGQGGYVRKADAFASGADVLNDPEALSARVDHAHNEWLEVWVDLGSVGLVLALGGLVLTLAGGASVVRSLPTVTQRWVLTALLASLVALIVEETAGVGLRLAGLPPVYYTVLGFIWAFCRPEPPGLARFLQAHALTRGLSVVGGTALALAVGYFISFRDFQAARAQQEVPGALERLEWDRAIQLAERGRAARLRPQRRLTAQDVQCATYLHIAHVYQAAGARRVATARQSDPVHESLLALAKEDIEKADTYRRRGMERLRDLVRKAPSFYNSNWLEYSFEQVRAEGARTRGDFEGARQYERDAAVALKRELARRPYDVTLAGRYVVAAGPTVSLEETCTLLARPLRFNRIPAAYPHIVSRLLRLPTFATEFGPIYERAYSTPLTDLSQWADPFAPESLRLAALVGSENGDGRSAEQALERAKTLYGVLDPRFAYGAAACLAELAERRFLNAPLDPRAALAEAEEAIRRAPPSNEGRQLVTAVRNLLVAMHLAAGNETAAAEVLRPLGPPPGPAGGPGDLSAGYTALVSLLLGREGQTPLHRIRQWTARAVELDPGNERAWGHQADLAFRDGDDVECVRCLRQARRCGAADEMIYRFVDIALQRRPTSDPLRAYSQELGRELTAPRGGPGESGLDSTRAPE